MDKYFDKNDFDSHSIKDQVQYYYLPMDADRGQAKVFTIRQSRVEKDDSWTAMEWMGDTEDKFYSVFQDYDYSRSHDASY
jgi:hypothetical protein